MRCLVRTSSPSTMLQFSIRTVAYRAKRIAFASAWIPRICKWLRRESCKRMKTAFHPADLAGIQVRPSRLWTQSLSWILFAVGIALYAQFSIARHKETPEDRVVPAAQQLIQGIKSAALEAPEEDDSVDANAPLIERFSHSMLWKDTLSSGKRFLIALALLIPAILLGLHMTFFPYFGSLCLRFVIFFDKIVALSLLPILFIVFGIEEWSKIALMVIGVAPTLILDTFNI